MACGEEEDCPLLELFDSFWFQQTVLSSGKKEEVTPQQSLAEPSKLFDEVHEELFQKSELPRVSTTLHVRSLSDQSFAVDLPSPDSVLTVPHLETILSGKEVMEFATEARLRVKETEESGSLPTKPNRRTEKQKRRRKKQGNSKSLSELEFEELKGFMDLGFVFSEQDKDSADLVSIIPGLQRLGKNGEKEEDFKAPDKSSVPRPYLSEAWEVLDRRTRAKEPLVKWSVPDLGNEMAVKDQLRFWAHAVASTVR